MNIASLNATIGINTNPARASLNSINTSLNNFQGNLRLTLNQINNFSSGASAGFARVRSEAGLLSGAMSTTLGNLTSSAVLGGVKMIAGGVKDLVDRGLDYNEVLERASIGFTTMMGSADKAAEHIKELQKFAATTPFEFKGLVQNSQFLQAMGFEAREIIPLLNSVGDALGAAGRPEALDRVLLQLGQMKSKGKVMASEINLIAEAGIPVWKILSEQVGKSVKELQQLGEQGKLNSDVFQELLFRGMDQKYGGAMKLASQTRSGLMSNLQDALDLRSGQATTGLNEEMKRSIKSASEFISGPGGEALAKSMNTASTVAGIAFNETLTTLIGSGDFIAKATTIGGDVVNGLSDGIVQTTEKVKAAATTTANGVIDTFKSVFAIQSPSKVMMQIGQDVGEGFAIGLRARLEELARDPRIRAMLDTIAFAEGADYDTKVGGGKLPDLSDKDRSVVRLSPTLKSSAAGRYQILNSTWDAIQKQLNLPDFSAHSQDLAATYLMQQRGMIKPLMEGNIPDAIKAGNQEWASLPGSPYGQKTRSMNRLLEVYDNALKQIEPGISAAVNEFSVSLSTVLQNATAQLQTNFDLAEMPSRKAGFVSADKDPFGTASDPWKKIGHLFEAQPVQVDISPIVPALEQTIAKYQELKPLVLDVVTVTAQLAETNQKVAQAANQVTETQQQAFERLTSTGEETASKMKDNLKSLAQQAQDIFGDAFNALFTEGFQGFKEKLIQGFSQLLQQLASQLAQSLLMGLFKKLLGGALGGALGGGGGVGDAFGGYFASGGRPPVGRPSIVGERGPEVFVPDVAGLIIPNQGLAMAGMGGAPIINISFTIPAPGGTISQASQRQVAARTGEAITRALNRNR